MRTLLSVICAAAFALAASSASAQDKKWTQVGNLVCVMGPNIGLLVGSRQDVKCVFRSTVTGIREAYLGTMARVGLDIGITGGGQMVWAVMARTRNVPRRALVGTYVGGSSDISLGVGVGANALFGGSDRSISLQPVSLEGQVGANLALGVASFTLR
jgi:hypothetical protein